MRLVVGYPRPRATRVRAQEVFIPADLA